MRARARALLARCSPALGRRPRAQTLVSRQLVTTNSTMRTELNTLGEKMSAMTSEHSWLESQLAAQRALAAGLQEQLAAARVREAEASRALAAMEQRLLSSMSPERAAAEANAAELLRRLNEPAERAGGGLWQTEDGRGAVVACLSALATHAPRTAASRPVSAFGERFGAGLASRG